MGEHPKAFISHAGKDQDRFVTGFARRLIAKGVDAWYSKWEMQPGDKLIEKLFDEGIGNADTLIVVLSKNSVDRPWVREEMDAGFVRRVEKKLNRLIPVVIEDCEIPIALQSTLHIRIRDLDAYDQELDQIVSAVFGLTDKPALGSTPAYSRVSSPGIDGLPKIDSIVLRLSCETAMQRGYYFVETHQIWSQAEALGIPESEFHDSIRILHEQGIFNGVIETTPTIEHFTVSLAGFHEWAKACLPDLDIILTTVAARIENDKLRLASQITRSMDQPPLMIEYALDLFANQEWISCGKKIDGEIRISYVSPQLKRNLLS